ncbi:MAG: sensor histidine kinase [Phototrophicaceae bacterium]
MTEQNLPSNRNEVEGVLQRIARLGSATEHFFSRLYRNLSRRSEQERQLGVAHKLYKQRQQLKAILERREQELVRLHGIIASIDEGIILQNIEGRVELINDAAKQMLGNQRTFRESGLSALFENYKDVTHIDSELAPLGEPRRLEVNNRILGATLAAVADKDGNRIGTLVVLRDVTEAAIGERLKDQFTTAISHELRTPMNVVKMSSEVLRHTPEGQPANRRMLELIGRNVDILDRMIVELLDISEMTAGSFQIRQDVIELEPLIWDVIHGLMPEIKGSRLDVAVMARNVNQLTITGDYQRLRWALGHMLQNSIRYTEPDGHIIVTLSIDNEQITLQVVDTGVGIAEKDLPHIFERFYRGEARTQAGRLLDPRGLGQGLFIARTVAEAHEGFLSVRSKTGEGSVFTMSLPKAS